MVNAIIHNFGENASSHVVHFAIDMKAAIQYVGERRADYENGLMLDPALSIDLEASYPEEDHEYLNEHLFFQAFSIDSVKPEEIFSWVSERFNDPPSYIWVNRKMVGGLCFPQEAGADDFFSSPQRRFVSVRVLPAKPLKHIQIVQARSGLRPPPDAASLRR